MAPCILSAPARPALSRGLVDVGVGADAVASTLAGGGGDLADIPLLASGEVANGWTLALRADGSSTTGGTGVSFAARGESAGNFVSVTDAGAPYNPTLRWPYSTGYTGGTEPGVQYGTPGGTRVYMVWWSRLSSNFRGHGSAVNKQTFQFLSAGGANPYCALRFSGTASTGYPDSLLEWGTPAWLSEYSGGAQFQIAKDAWTRWEWLLIHQDSGETPRYALWVTSAVDGVRRVVHDINPTARGKAFPTATFAESQVAPTWGGVGETVPETQYLFMDDWRVYRP